MLALDLGVFHKEARSLDEGAGAWSALWVTLALASTRRLPLHGPAAGLEFLTGYLSEKALSVDNIFVFVLIFSYFNVPSRYQHRGAVRGILGALLMRGAMIAAGAALITDPLDHLRLRRVPRLHRHP